MALTSIRRVLVASLLCGCVVQIIQAAPFDNWGNHVLADLGWLFDIEETTTPQPTRHEHLVSVHHFARHALCRTREQQKKFSRIMAERFCNMPENFSAENVQYLCDKKDFMLDRWVSQMFDNDGDGKITIFERRQYNGDLEELNL